MNTWRLLDVDDSEKFEWLFELLTLMGLVDPWDRNADTVRALGRVIRGCQPIFAAITRGDFDDIMDTPDGGKALATQFAGGHELHDAQALRRAAVVIGVVLAEAVPVHLHWLELDRYEGRERRQLLEARKALDVMRLLAINLHRLADETVVDTM